MSPAARPDVQCPRKNQSRKAACGGSGWWPRLEREEAGESGREAIHRPDLRLARRKHPLAPEIGPEVEWPHHPVRDRCGQQRPLVEPERVAEAALHVLAQVVG